MHSARHNLALGRIALAGTALFWSLAGIFIKVIPWHPFAIAGARSLIAALFILAIVRKPKFTFSFAQVAAALSYTGTMLLFVYANKNTTSANAILLQYGAPIYTGILGALIIKERPRLEHLLGFVVVAAGMLLFFVGDAGSAAGRTLHGDLAAIASGVTFALFYVFMRMQKDGSPVESTLLSHLFTALIAGGISLFMPAPLITAPAIGAILGLGILQLGIASVLFSWGIKRVGAMEGILIGGLEPVFNPIWVFLFIGERPGLNALAGGALILIAVVITSMISARRETLLASRILTVSRQSADTSSGTNDSP